MTTERERYGAGRVVDSRGPEDRTKLQAAAVNKGIRKLGKAHWEFRCGMCGARWTGVDQWSVYEYGWNHNRDAAATHFLTAAQSAIDTIADAFTALLKPVSEVVKVVGEMTAFTPEPNRPHDPSLLRDKRKWGGK